jgi:hypothetical protein
MAMGVGLRPTTKAVEEPPNPTAHGPRIYPDIRRHGSMSGEWKRNLGHPATPRLYTYIEVVHAVL